ncbi:MAG: MBL fold metallo-hydrolase [Planctomycetes bacterium]|nr:MBL fold metallo-hydrolase [Planctomycetota bacterium]
MATRARGHSENVPGSFFVDDTCIDCDTCRQVAPLVFADAGDHSFVQLQPESDADVRLAARAVLCCPTNSIGSDRPAEVRAAASDFPVRIDVEVYACGFNAESSFGAHSYFVRRPEGNWLIDSPRWMPALATRFAELGGIANIFLTHRDDVADARRYADRFSATVIIHALDASAFPVAGRVLDGVDPQELAAGIVAIPTPGHTAGHCVLLVDDTYLFSGDHLWWSRPQGRLSASRSVCWHSWSEQCRSMRRLAERRFSWVLPGHGERMHLDDPQGEILALCARMTEGAASDKDAPSEH